MKGCYILVIEAPESQEIAIGKLGVRSFPQGYYAYVGSAQNGFKTRIGHHLRDEKRAHWHIDYLLEQAHIEEILLYQTEDRIECALARALSEELSSVPGFGSSDCKCSSHLFFETDRDKLQQAIQRAAGMPTLRIPPDSPILTPDSCQSRSQDLPLLLDPGEARRSLNPFEASAILRQKGE